MLVDGDSHFYEYPSLWRDHMPAADAHLALSVQSDELGYSQLSYGGRQLFFVVPTYPLNPSASGAVRARRAAGLPAEADLYDQVPRDYWDVEARAQLAEGWGVDRSILFPQFQGLIDSLLLDDLAGARANMQAWNRWAVEVVQQTKGRLTPVGHIRLDGDRQWIIDQIVGLGGGRCRFVTFVPGLIAGKPPSHPDNTVVWNAFVDSGVAPIWHITAGHRYAVANIAEWESTGGFGPATGMFLNVASQLSLSDMIFNGVFERHPDLHVVLAELGIDWIPTFLAEMDLRERNLNKQQGRGTADSHQTPSEIFHQHVTSVVSCPTDRDIEMVLKTGGDGLSFGSDYPHGCSSPDPVADMRSVVDGRLNEEQQAEFFGGRLTRLLP